MNKVPINMYLSYYGKETIDLDTHGKSSGRSGNYSTNYQIAGREKMTPDEVRLLDNNYALCFIRGERPIKDYKYDILKHPNIALTTDGGEKPYIHGKTDKASASIIVLDENNGEEIVTNFCQKKKLRHLLGRNKYTLKNKKILKQVLKNIARILFYIVILFIAQASNVFAADDPLAVVNNLSNFIFGLIRAVGMIILGFGVVQVGMSLKSHDPSQRANGIMTLAGGIVITFAKEILNIITGG